MSKLMKYALGSRLANWNISGLRHSTPLNFTIGNNQWVYRQNLNAIIATCTIREATNRNIFSQRCAIILLHDQWQGRVDRMRLVLVLVPGVPLFPCPSVSPFGLSLCVCVCFRSCPYAPGSWSPAHLHAIISSTHCILTLAFLLIASVTVVELCFRLLWFSDLFFVFNS